MGLLPFSKGVGVYNNNIGSKLKYLIAYGTKVLYKRTDAEGKGKQDMGKTESRLPSKDGKHKLHVVFWKPEQPVRGVVQISHGMIEMIERYDDFARYLNDNGFAVIGNDHLGHGQTAGGDEDFGYFCRKNMSATVVADLHRVTRYAKKHYSEVPYFLLGHSMGSFMARRYIMTYGNELTGAVIIGTGSQSALTLIYGNALAALIRYTKGDRYRSKLLEWSAFHHYLDRIKNPRSENDWVTRDEKIVDLYRENKYCNFKFTVNGYRTLFEVLTFIQNDQNIENIPRELPLLFLAGGMDPVGNYGKAVNEICCEYKKKGINDVSMKLYPDDRHEILNELDREQVYGDILRWLENHL